MERHLKIATILTKLLEKQFGFGRFRFGLDPVLGLIPGLGDVITLVLSFYLVWIGFKIRVPNEEIAKMIRNILFDFILGLIPLVGDLSDFVYKANSKNLVILNNHAKQTVIEAEIISSSTPAY